MLQHMKNLGPLMRQQRFKEAESLLDEVVKLLEIEGQSERHSLNLESWSVRCVYGTHIFV